MKKQISGDGRTIRMRDGPQALEPLMELDVVSIPEDGVKLVPSS